MEEGVKLMEGRKELTPVLRGGRTCVCCPPSQHQSRSPTTHDFEIHHTTIHIHIEPGDQSTPWPIEDRNDATPEPKPCSSQPPTSTRTPLSLLSAQRRGRDQGEDNDDLEWFHDARPTSTRRRFRETDQQSHSSHIHHMSFPPTRFSTDT